MIFNSYSSRYYINAELNKIKKHGNELTFEQRDSELQNAINNVWEHKKSLLINVDRLTKADGHDNWRENESKELSDLVQRRFTYLQNPKDCNKAKKLICNLNKGCGFGCQVILCYFSSLYSECPLNLENRHKFTLFYFLKPFNFFSKILILFTLRISI